MRQVKTESRRIAIVAGLLAFAVLGRSGWAVQGGGQTPAVARMTVFQGGRLIVGDGRAPIDDAAFIIDGARFVRVGRTGDAPVPQDATRVDLTGKTVMPAIVDTHTHLSRTREMLVEDLQRRAYYGVGSVMSLGQDSGDLPFQVRGERIPNAARFRTAGRGITMPEPGRTDIPYWITTQAEGRKAVQELATRKVDLVKIWERGCARNRRVA